MKGKNFTVLRLLEEKIRIDELNKKIERFSKDVSIIKIYKFKLK